MKRITIRLLGPFEVSIDGVPVTRFEYAKVRALLAYLAVEARPHPRAQLAALLWPEQPERAARASLSQALTTLRHALGDATAQRPALLTDTQFVQLDPDCSPELDVTQFLAALSVAESHAHRSWRTCASCSERLRQALDVYRGQFLAGLSIDDSAPFEEWASAQREQLLQRALSAFERLVERAQWRGAYGEALAYAQRLIALEPWIEVNQRACMRLLALNGETTAALAQYRRLQAMLERELDAEPEAATTTLYEQIRRGDTAALEPSPPPFVVPEPPTTLVGRDDELQTIGAHLRNMNGRTLTITGTGGIGKTRIAIEVARLLRHDFEDGVYVVELAALNDATLVAAATARLLGVQERPRQPIGESLRDHLRSKHLLLVLDNFEHVMDAAPLVGELLAACPALTVLVTSRAPLNIRAEQQFVLEPLADADAVQLFMQRAHAMDSALATDAADMALYTAICRQLDRLPLAIELIAVRARTLSPLDLLQQLEHPLRALSPGPRDGSGRHRSLRQAIQWSYDLLDAETQRAFRHLGVFAGGWSIEAAQAVLGESVDVLPMLENLHQASLLQRQEVAGETRLLVLETIREFALEELTPRGEAAAAHQRHVSYYADFSMRAYVELLRSEAPRWRAWVAAEQDNLRAAFRWAVDHQLHEAALQLATGVWRFYMMNGYVREALERLETALLSRYQAPLQVQFNALHAAGTLAVGLSDYARARRWLQAAVEVGWHLHDQNALQKVQTNFGYALHAQGELEEARFHLEVSLSLAYHAADPTVAKFPLGILSGVHRRLGDLSLARTMCEEGLRLNRACRDIEGTANALRSLAEIVIAQGDVLHARQLVEEALALHSSLDHQIGVGFDYAVLGDVAQLQGDDEGAFTRYQQCLSLWRDRENSVNCAVVFDRLARTLSRMDHSGRGATLLGAAAAIREQAGVKLSAIEQASNDVTLSACRAALGEAAFASAWATGRVLTTAQAIDLALQPLVVLQIA